jgi:hypothetical protein
MCPKLCDRLSYLLKTIPKTNQAQNSLPLKTDCACVLIALVEAELSIQEQDEKIMEARKEFPDRVAQQSGSVPFRRHPKGCHLSLKTADHPSSSSRTSVYGYP